MPFKRRSSCMFTVWFQKKSIPSRMSFFWGGGGRGGLVSCFPLKIWAFKIPLALGISYDHPLWGGNGHFLEPTFTAKYGINIIWSKMLFLLNIKLSWIQETGWSAPDWKLSHLTSWGLCTGLLCCRILVSFSIITIVINIYLMFYSYLWGHGQV